MSIFTGHPLNYRAEIDGLRAVAVLPVMLFHAEIWPFSGGYIGVDVFFVISGFLITSLIMNDLESGQFDLANFYERRARRILPALFIVMFACVPFAWLLMLPVQMRNFSESLISTNLFFSNFHFWVETGYFSLIADRKPLLHTWSLAVEEQYYLLFPPLFLATWQFGKKPVYWMIVVLSALSLGLSEWGSREWPNANFYLLPTRAWELFAGSIVAFIVRAHKPRSSHLFSFIGLASIFAAIFIFNSNVPTPSVYTLLPVVGTALVILFAKPDTHVGKLLSNKALVGIGLISYSAYLWHQPILAFARIRTLDEPHTITMLLLLLLALGLAFITWKYVEKPCRKRGGITFPKLASAFAFSALVLGTTGVVGHANGGYENRYSEEQLALLGYQEYPRATLYRLHSCFLNHDQDDFNYDSDCVAETGPLIWGDSHAAALASGWRLVEPSLTQITASGCPPVINVDIPQRPGCRGVNDSVMEYLGNNTNHQVYLHASWLSYESQYREQIRDTVRALDSLGIEEIVVVGGVPHYYPSLPARLLHERAEFNAEHWSSLNLGEVRSVDSELQSSIENTAAQFLSVLEVICKDEQCLTLLEFDGEYMPIAWDDSHLTLAGSVYISELLDLGDTGNVGR